MTVTTRGSRVSELAPADAQPHDRRRRAPILLGVVLATAPGPRSADDASQKDEVKLHYQRATRAYDLQKYQEAIDEYQKAYEISGDPAML